MTPDEIIVCEGIFRCIDEGLIENYLASLLFNRWVLLRRDRNQLKKINQDIYMFRECLVAQLILILVQL